MLKRSLLTATAVAGLLLGAAPAAHADMMHVTCANTESHGDDWVKAFFCDHIRYHGPAVIFTEDSEVHWMCDHVYVRPVPWTGFYAADGEGCLPIVATDDDS